MSTTHTAEPWVVHKPRRDFRYHHDSQGRAHGDTGIEILAQLTNDEGQPGGFQVVVGHINCQPDTRILRTEDAARITACVNGCKGLNPIGVPRLITALQAIVEAGRLSDQPRAVYCADIARAALAKALG